MSEMARQMGIKQSFIQGVSAGRCKSVGSDKLEVILQKSTIPISALWLLTGRGEMYAGRGEMYAPTDIRSQTGSETLEKNFTEVAALLTASKTLEKNFTEVATLLTASNQHIASLNKEVERLNAVVADLTAENLALKNSHGAETHSRVVSATTGTIPKVA